MLDLHQSAVESLEAPPTVRWKVELKEDMMEAYSRLRERLDVAPHGEGMGEDLEMQSLQRALPQLDLQLMAQVVGQERQKNWTFPY